MPDIFDQISSGGKDIFDSISLPSRAKSLTNAPVKGLIKGVSESIAPFSPSSGPIPGSGGLQGRMTPESAVEFNQQLEASLPTQQKLPEQLSERAAKLLPLALLGRGALASKAAQLGGATILGQIAQQNETSPLGEGLAEAAGFIAPGILKGSINTARKGAQSLMGVVKGETEKLPSGLTKLRAIDSSRLKRAVISPSKKEETISKLNEEASKLAKNSAEKHAPLTKKLAEGYDFTSEHEKRFGQLTRAAESANPEINIKPLSQFLREESSKYRGIPHPHQDARKIIKEISSFRTRPETELKNLLRIYRSNNQKVKNIFETSRLTGKQQEYVDFLSAANKKIAQSIEETLPSDSPWLKEFKETNAQYRDFQKAVKTLDLIDPILGQRATPSSLQKFATDKKKIGQLELALGKDGAKEISQLASDLKRSQDAVKKMSVKEFNKWELAAPLSVFIPVPGLGKVAGLAFGVKKAYDLGRKGYGYLLSTPSRRKEYENVLKAIESNNYESYAKSAKTLLDSVNSPEN